ncbi:TetR/AcrR family transcriptional regulator [Mycobacterium talmoniae]|uniref:Putative HTH-type transcriptional regulator n=1 Tax=Mycobacterium talmoniae TaxID=1858794 RepID=A0A2S8BK55_9MYCO|nr:MULTISPECIES: TetR/AcrR family transcriptional regulator [Mycobacterium]PQM47060.1 putative HTH-type transcriptional regulator [Mycobacterium talmoniae]
MSLSSAGVSQRRRGRALEEALLDAAWAELTERGYDDFTIDAVAARAGTSRAVLYRRWPGKQELVLAALQHEVGKDVVTAPDTGSLRGDVIALLQQANKVRVGLATQLFTQLGGFYRQTGASLSDLSAFVHGGRNPALDEVIQRAIDRGEIQPEQVPERIARLPVDLFRYEILMTLRPLADEAIEEIVDTIFLPLLRSRRTAEP